LASLTGELSHYHEAALARPDLPSSRAGLGCALARAGRAHDAVPHLEAAALAGPFHRRAPRACYQSLLDAKLGDQAEALRSDQLALYLSAPKVVPPEPYFARPPVHTGPARAAGEGQLAVVWQGAFRERHSLALVNRQACRGLLERGHALSLVAVP